MRSAAEQPSRSLAALCWRRDSGWLQAGEAVLLCQWALHLLHSYAAAQQGTTRQAQQAGANEDAERELRALVKLLTSFLQRDLLDFSEGAADGSAPAVPVGEVRCVGFRRAVQRQRTALARLFHCALRWAAPTAINAHVHRVGSRQAPARLARPATQHPAANEGRACLAQVVLAGLLALLPQMQAPLLAFPRLCTRFFALLALVLELHPGEVARLSGEPLARCSCGRWQQVPPGPAAHGRSDVL